MVSFFNFSYCYNIYIFVSKQLFYDTFYDENSWDFTDGMGTFNKLSKFVYDLLIVFYLRS